MKLFQINFQLILVVALSLMVSIISVLFPLALKEITDTLVLGVYDNLFNLFIIGTLLAIMQMLFLYISGKAGNLYITNRVIKLKERLGEAILGASYTDFIKRDKEEYHTLLFSNIQILEDDYFNSVLNILTKGLLLICSLITLLILQPILTLALITIVIIVALLPLAFSKKIISLKEAHIKLNEIYFNTVNEMLDGFYIIRIYNRHKVFRKKSKTSIGKLEVKNRQLKDTILLANVIFGSSTVLIMLIIFLIGGYFVSKEILTIGALIAFIQLVMYVIEPIVSIAQDFNKVTSTKPIRGQIIELLDIEGIDEERVNNDEIIQEITLKNISYKYTNTDKPIIQNINLKFKKGKKYAIVGENGSGKSTLLKILAGLITDFNGCIYINNRLHQGTINHIGFVDQDNFLFEDTLLNNITLLDTNTDLSSNIVSLLEKMEGNNQKTGFLVSKLNDDIGHNGELLSGGQRQKVAIARALLHSPQVLLLDEPSSALDIENKLLLYKLLQESTDCISIMVTHEEKSTLAFFDEVIEIKDGKVYIQETPFMS